MGNNVAGSRLAGRWYVVVIVCSAGLLAWLPFVHANHRLRRPAVTRLVWQYAVAAVVIGLLVGLAPRDARGEIATTGAGNIMSAFGGLIAIATIALACVQQSALRREVYGGALAPEKDAVAIALEARDRRAAARQLAQRDPLLARDLKVGRPDLPGTYDDGGVVDLNSAPPEVIAAVCDLDPATAATIVDARPPTGYLAVDDVFSHADIPFPAWEIIRDRGVVIPFVA